jgi:hypothetical protein
LIPTDTKQLKAIIPRRIGQERRSSDRCKPWIFAVILETLATLPGGLDLAHAIRLGIKPFAELAANSEALSGSQVDSPCSCRAIFESAPVAMLQSLISPNFGFSLRTPPQTWIPASSFQSRSYAIEISGTSPLVVLRYMGWLGKGRETAGSSLSRLPFQPPESPGGQLRNSYQSFDIHGAKLDDCSVCADQEQDDQQERPNWINNSLDPG